MEQTVDDPMPQVMIDTVVDCRCASARVSGRNGGAGCGFQTPGKASGSGAHPRAHFGADTGILRATDHQENRGGVAGSDSGAHSRGHGGTELPKTYRRRKRQKGKPGRDSEELLEAALARAREEEDEFFQAVPQDEGTRERQAEVYFSEESGDA